MNTKNVPFPGWWCFAACAAYTIGLAVSCWQG